jgi:hypothetical protein
MFRRLLLGAGAVALVVGATSGAGLSVASATSPPVDMAGTMTCSVNGTLTFSTALTNGGTTPTSATVSAILSNCTGDGATNGGVTITTGALTAGPTRTFANNCGKVLSGSRLPTLHGSINWSATGGTVTPTTLKFKPASIYDNLSISRLVLGLPTVLKTGSYAQTGSAATFSGLNSNSNDSTLSAKCSDLASGLKSVAFGAVVGSNPGGSVTFEAGA